MDATAAAVLALRRRHPGNGGDYARVSNPWVSHAPDGSAIAVAIAGNGVLFQPGSANAILASRSLDGGASWSAPATLILDGSGFFNDKVAVAADPFAPGRVYVAWDRLVAGDNGGPTYFARSSDGGANWERARSIYDPGPRAQTIDNVPLVLPDGGLLVMLVQIDYGAATGGGDRARIAVVRSDDQGTTWGAPAFIADLLSVGTRDPATGAPVRDASILPQAAVAPNGDIYVAWQDSRFSNGAALSRDDIRDRPHWGFALLALCLVIAGLMYFQADRGRMHAPALERVMPY